MAMAVRAYPLRTGLAALKGFGKTLLNERNDETNDFFRRHGVQHESWHVQRIDGVEWIICCTHLRDRAAAEASYGASRHAFDTWFKEQVIALTGIDPNRTPLGLPSEQIFAWTDARETEDLAL
jgi:hypothetical protein